MPSQPQNELGLPASLSSLYDLKRVAAALEAEGWTPEEQIELLLEMARGAAKPMERLAAMKTLMAYIKECRELNAQSVVMTRRIEHVGQDGNRIVDTLEFTNRYTGLESPSARIAETSVDFRGDSGFVAPDE